ncbi:hypothetical protein IscW_ISCW014466, partial [Ixodes scapularis]
RRKHNSPHGRPTKSSRSLRGTPCFSRAARESGPSACEQLARRRARNRVRTPEPLRKYLAHRCQTSS